MIRICHHVPVSSTRNIVVFEYHDVRRRHDDHHRIFEAVVAREPWRAEMLMREHVASIKTSLVGYLSERKKDHPGEGASAASPECKRRVRYSVAITAGLPSRNPKICNGVWAWLWSSGA